VVINALVERQLWLGAAEQMGLTVTSRELAHSIAAIPAFEKEGTGRFDSDCIAGCWP
jgi:hypothetical protein